MLSWKVIRAHRQVSMPVINYPKLNQHKDDPWEFDLILHQLLPCGHFYSARSMHMINLRKRTLRRKNIGEAMKCPIVLVLNDEGNVLTHHITIILPCWLFGSTRYQVALLSHHHHSTSIYVTTDSRIIFLEGNDWPELGRIQANRLESVWIFNPFPNVYRTVCSPSPKIISKLPAWDGMKTKIDNGQTRCHYFMPFQINSPLKCWSKIIMIWISKRFTDWNEWG